jgi:hypothetical protein
MLRVEFYLYLLVSGYCIHLIEGNSCVYKAEKTLYRLYTLTISNIFLPS